MADRPTTKTGAKRPQPASKPRSPRRWPRIDGNLVVALLAGLVTAYGVFFDRTLRSDPFGGPQSPWEWLTTRQPARELETIPVVPLGARGELSWRPRVTSWVFKPVDELVKRALPDTPGAQATPFPGTLRRCFDPQDRYCPIGETPAEPRAPAAAARFEAPAREDAPRLIKAAFAADQSKDPKYLQQDVKQQPPEQTSKTPDARAVAPPPRPRPRQTPRPKAQPKPEPTPTRAPEAPPAATSAYKTVPPAVLAALGRSMTAGAPAADAEGRGTAAACGWDGAVCIVTDGARLGGLTTDGGRRFFPAGALRTDPSPSVEKTGPRRYVVHALPTRGGPEPSVMLRVAQVAVTLDPSPAAAAGSQFQRVDGALYHSGPDNPLLALIWSNAELRRQVTGGGCYDFTAAPDQPFGATDRLCAGLLTGGRMLFHRVAADAPGEGEAWPVTLAVDPTSIVFLDPEHGYVSTSWAGKTPPQIFETRDHGRSWKQLKYDALPAPWAYLSGAVFLFAFVGAAGGMLRKREARAEGIEAAGVSDLPIGWADPDPLKLKPVAMALSRFVRNSQTKPPLTIAISGVWGSGKSSLMNLVYEDLQERRVRPVWFNAWHHQKEDHLLAALLENIRSQATPPVWTASGLNYRLRILRHRGREVANAVVLALLIVGAAVILLALGLREFPGTDAAAIAKALAPTLGLPTSVLAFLAVAGALAKRTGLSPAALLASLKGNASLGELSGQLSFRHRFAREFEDATQALRVGADAGLVVFIDDLDRCAPGNLMEILEAVNFLASGRAPVFIFLGMDEDRVVKAVATQPPISDGARKDWTDSDRIAAEEQARLYLHKLINVTVPVPEATLEGTLGLVDGEPPPPQPVWGPRLLRFARAAPDVVAPLAVAALLFIWVGVEVGDASARQMAKADDEVSAPTARTPVSPAAAAGGATTSATGATPDPAAATAAQAPPPEVVTPQPAPPTPAWVWAVLALGPLAVGLLIAALLLARRAVVVAFDQEEDSARFREALQIWHPLVFMSDRTPRGVKRHQNRLRLKAMRLKPAEAAAGLGRLLHPEQANASAPEKLVPDEMLVALEALRQAQDGLLTDALAGRAPDPIGEPEAVRKTQAAQAALSRFRERFPDAWPPSQEQLDAFATLDHAFGRDA